MSGEARMIEKLLEFYLSERPLTYLKVCQTADVDRVEVFKRARTGEFVPSCWLQELDSFGRVVGMYLNGSLNSGQ